MLDILDVDSRELDKQNTRLLSISVLITTVFFAHTMVSPYGRNLINICWLNKQMKDVFVTWSGKQYRSVVASWASEWQDEKCLKSLFWQWIFQVTLRNNYMALLMEPFLLEIAAWLSHILNISSFMLSNAKKSNITNTINWINLTFMPYDILLSYHSICIIHQQWTKKERLCIHYIWQQSYIK